MRTVLIDSDVLLDVLYNRPKFHENSLKILNLCEKKEIVGYTTPLIIANVYYILNKTSPHQKIAFQLNNLLSFVDIISLNKSTILKALHSNFKDFEDALQNYAAEYSKKIDIVITRNIKDYKNSKLAVLTPETYLKTLTTL